MNIEEFVAVGNKFKDVDISKLPPQLIIEISRSQKDMLTCTRILENCMITVMDLQKQAIVLDSISKIE